MLLLWCGVDMFCVIPELTPWRWCSESIVGGGGGNALFAFHNVGGINDSKSNDGSYGLEEILGEGELFWYEDWWLNSSIELGWKWQRYSINLSRNGVAENAFAVAEEVTVIKGLVR